MPLGRAARRLAPGLMNLALALASGSAGCNALSTSTRVVPPAAEVKTRVEPDRPAVVERVAVAPVEERSPLPPAIEKPAPTPLLDEALVQARTREREFVEALAKDDAPKAAPVATPPPRPTAPAPIVAAPKPAPAPAPEPEPKRPEEVWREGVQRLRAVAVERLKGPRDAGPGAPNWAVRARLLAWIAEPDIDPDARGSDDVARGRAVLKGLAAVLEPIGPPEARAAEIREAVVALESRAPLEIAELRPCRSVRGFGDVEPLDPAERRPGQAVILYCEIDGLAYRPDGDAFRSRVDGRVELLRDGSDAPVWSQPLPTVEDACRRRRRDYYIGHKFTLPDSIPPGHYRLRLTQKDLVADHVATRETPIAIVR